MSLPLLLLIVREKDIARAIAHSDKQMTRMRQWNSGGPPDDLDLEWERLTGATGAPKAPGEGGPDATPQAAPASSSAPGDHADIVRPEFPPPSLKLTPVFPALLGDGLGSELLIAWGFLCRHVP
jgi:hypothetical protein